MISYSAFYDELVKIARDDDRYVTKEKLKRHLKTVAATGIGAGAGAGVGGLLRKYLKGLERAGKLKKVAPHLPKALSVVGGLAGLAEGFRRQRIRKYVEEGR